MKKIASVLCAVGLLLCTAVMFTGCKKPVYEQEIRNYMIFERNYSIDYDFPKKEEDCWICIGITEEGQRQTYLEVPSEINGLPVRKLGIASNMFSGRRERLTSEVLETIYISENVNDLAGGVFYYSRNLKTVLCASMSLGTGDDHVFYTYRVGAIYIPYCGLVDYYGYINEHYIYPANVTYMYNFEGSNNEGVYRIDNVPKGNALRKPAIPVREGYKFTGWFKDSACENAWDFTNDLTEHEISNTRTYDMEDLNLETFGTILYAGWEEA